MDQESPRPAPPAAPLPPAPVEFTGSGTQYFGIWIVNLLLTLVTIGIYSPWAKVRRMHYFYRHTELAGSTFDFHGDPKKILIGRVIALVMLVSYNVSVRLHSVWTLVILLAIAVAMPWLLRNSFRFRLYNTSWRGVRFHFRGSAGDAYRVFLLNGFLTLVTLYVMAPFMHQRLKAYQHDNTWFGETRCSFHARVGQFYGLYVLVLVGVVLFGVLVGVSGIGGVFAALAQAQQHGTRPNPAAFIKAMAILYGGLVVLGLVIGSVFHALLTNLIWNNTRIGEHRIECRLAPLGLLWISISNLALVVITLGFYMPWAAVRLMKFQLGAMRLLPAGNLETIVDAGPDEVGAVGEETATAFDFDISL